MNNLHCVSLELAKQLKEAGWKKETEFWWNLEKNAIWNVFHKNNFNNGVEQTGLIGALKPCSFLSAPLATEILEELPCFVKMWKTEMRGTAVGYLDEIFDGDNLPNTLAKMWIYLKKEKLL